MVLVASYACVVGDFILGGVLRVVEKLVGVCVVVACVLAIVFEEGSSS